MQATNNGLVKFPLASTFNIAVSDTATIMGFADTSNPFIPEINSSYVFRKEFVTEFRAFLHQPDGDAYYVTGPTGSGKTSGITEILGRLNWPVQQVTAHGRMELSDLIGHHALVSATPGAAPTMQFMHGPLALGMKHGHVLLINEIDMMDPSELSGLNDILEGRPLVIAQNAGEIIKPHPMFRVV
ncbi:AAA family ATPase, partial [Pseudomonas sp. UBA3149]